MQLHSAGEDFRKPGVVKHGSPHDTALTGSAKVRLFTLTGSGRILRTFLAILLLISCSGSVTYSRENPLRMLSGTMRTRHFIVRYEPEDPFLAKLLAETAEDELERIARNLGYKPGKEPFKLYVFRTHVDFIKAGGLETSKFTVGTTTLSTDEIAVDASGVFDIPERIIAHEITHAVIFRMLGNLATVMPLWMHEGIAKYESREPYRYDEEMIATAAAEGSLIPLKRLRDSFTKTRTGLAYAESASAVRYLISKHGREAPRKILKEIINTASIDIAMSRVTGCSLDQFEREWLESVSKKYRGLRMIRLGTAFVSSLMAALAVIAYVVRRKQKMEQVDEDEHQLPESDSEDENHTTQPPPPPHTLGK